MAAAPPPTRVWRTIPRGIWVLGLRLAADGRLLGDDPRAAADLSGHRARRLGADRRHHRGDRRGDGVDHQGLLRRALRLARPAQAARRHRLRPRGLDQAGVRAGDHRSAGSSPPASSTASARASAARRATRWSPTSPRPHLRGASFGLRQSLDTVGAFAGPLLAIAIMALTNDNFTRRLLGRGDPGVPVVRADRLRGPRPEAARPKRNAGQGAAQPGRTEAPRRRLLVGDADRRRLHPRPLQRGVPDPEGAIRRHADRADPGASTS